MVDVVSTGDYHKIVNMTFSTQEDAYEFYNRYATRKGFSMRRSTVRKDKTETATTFRRFYCQKSGGLDKLLDKPGQKRKTETVAPCNCPAQLCVRLDSETSLWRVENFVNDHTHDFILPDPVNFLWSNPFIGAAKKLEMISFLSIGISISNLIKIKTLERGGSENVGFSIEDVYRFHGERFKMLQDDGELVTTLFRQEQESDSDFYFKFKREDNGLLSHIFWEDARSRYDYMNFGDVVALDTSRRLDEHNMTFVPIFGCGNHGTTLFFGCGIISGDKDGSYRWLLSAFREASCQVCPISVITDDNPALCTAVRVQLPIATHKICPVHIVRNAKKCIRNSRIMDKFNALMTEACTPETFVKNWSVFENSASTNPKSEQWLQLIYKWKHLWAGAFVKKEMFMGVSTKLINRTIHSTLHKQLNRKMSLINAVLHYESCLNNLRHEEAYLNCKTSQSEPVCTTSFLKIEKFTARTYTQSIFYIVREEIVMAGNFVIADKIKKGVRSVEYLLNLKGDADRSETVICSNCGIDLDLKCTCFKLEYEGFPCCHLFAVLIDMDVGFIPKSYIRKRWTKDANKTGLRPMTKLFRPWVNHMEEIESMNDELRRYMEKDENNEQFGTDLEFGSDEEESLFKSGNRASVAGKKHLQRIKLHVGGRTSADIVGRWGTIDRHVKFSSQGILRLLARNYEFGGFQS